MNRMRFSLPRKYMTLFTHVSSWVVFLGTPILFEPVVPESIPNLIGDLPSPELRKVMMLMLNCELIIIFYLNFSFFLPRFYLKGKVWQYFLAIACTYGVFQLSGYLLRQYVYANFFQTNYSEVFTQFSIQISSIFYVFILAASSGFRLGIEWRRTENQRRETERRRLETELTLLKSQINPHFLLNSLNNLYALALTQPAKTPDAILKLSELVAYILYECSQPKVPLAHDLKFIAHYLDLQRMRLPPNVALHVEMPEHVPELSIEPMLLINFIENAFKHGLTTKQNCTLEFIIRIQANHLSLEVINPIISGRKPAADDVSGMGIANTTHRLRHTYPERHTLQISNDGSSYRVQLDIALA